MRTLRDVGGQLDRIVRGDPPAARPVDWFMRYGQVGAFLLWVGALVGSRTSDLYAGLFIPAGALFATAGWLAFTNYAGARDFANARGQNGLWPRALRSGPWTRFKSGLLMAIGLGGALLGAAVLISEL